jgi:predicted DNA-binding transcriptional regulator YafY
MKALRIDAAQKLPSTATRTERALRILLLFSAKPEWGCSELLATLNVSRRTFFRDIQLLRRAGFAIETSENKRHTYTLVDASISIAVLPTEEEYLALLLAIQKAGPYVSESELASMERLLAKLVAVTPFGENA